MEKVKIKFDLFTLCKFFFVIKMSSGDDVRLRGGQVDIVDKTVNKGPL